MDSPFTVESHFEGKVPVVRAIYDCLLSELRSFGEVHEAPKKTSIHLDHANGFAGVYARRDGINLRFRLNHRLDHPRIAKIEQLSARRFMHTVRLTQVEDVDTQLLDWLKAAYDLAG
jgi:hypothetical protein